MLSAEEEREIASELAHSVDKRSACIEALKTVQRRRGWVSDEAIRDLAPLLEMSPHELDSVATFYSLIFRKPVGRHVILLCDSISCWIVGHEEIRDCLQEKLGIALGETTADERFTLLTVPCLGACDRAPAMMIDGDLHTELSADKIGAILEGYA
jgi:NADH-quinone oxidoreductase subunit E